jgi:hypothetical protein
MQQCTTAFAATGVVTVRLSALKKVHALADSHFVVHLAKASSGVVLHFVPPVTMQISTMLVAFQKRAAF